VNIPTFMDNPNCIDRNFHFSLSQHNQEIAEHEKHRQTP